MQIPFIAWASGTLMHFPVNIFDILFVIFFILYVFEEASLGFIPAVLDFLSIILSFFIGIALYGFFSGIIWKLFSIPKGLSDATSFLIVSVVVWIVFRVACIFVKRALTSVLLPSIANLFLGFLFAVLSYLFLASFVFSVLLSFPVSKLVKGYLTSSFAANFLALHTGIFESNIKHIFGNAGEDVLNFFTVEPQSDSIVRLHFTVKNPMVNAHEEEVMLNDLNKQRAVHNLPPLSADEQLVSVAQAHGKDMLQRGYFSHYTPEGYSPFDRMEAAGIAYTTAGENLAFAPTETIAMEGLMKSPGHRANILSPAFHKVGIGVLDAGIYGEIFVQEFTD